MNEETKTPVEQDVTNPVDNASKNPEIKDTVAYESYQKALNEKKSVQAKFNSANAELAKLRAEQEAAQNKTLEEQNQYKELWEQEKKAKEDALNNHSELRKNLDNATKLNAFEKELGTGLKKDEYYNFVDTSKIIINESGEVELDSVKLAVDLFRESFGDDLLRNKPTAKLPNSGVSTDKMVPVGFEAELKATRTQREFNAVLKKYNK